MVKYISFPKALILLPLTTFATFLGLLITPALPLIAKNFDLSESMAQWMISIFMIGYSLGQLPYGPIAKRYGRKKTITIGMSIAFLGTLLAYFATSFWMLCLARAIQAIGAAVGLKIAFTIVGDLHEGAGTLSAVSMLTMAFGIMPGIATAIGGYITVEFGWQECFLFLALYVILIWASTLAFPETAKNLDKNALEMKQVYRGFIHELRDRFVVYHAVFVGLSTTVLYGFSTLSPYIAIDLIGLDPEEFGIWASIPYLGILIGAFVSRALHSAFSVKNNMLTGVLIVFLGFLVITGCFLNQMINVWTLFIPMFFVYLGCNIIWTHAASEGLSKPGDKANVSAVIQFINMSTATIGIFLLEIVPPTTRMLLPIGLGVVLIAMIFTWFRISFSFNKK